MNYQFKGKIGDKIAWHDSAYENMAQSKLVQIQVSKIGIEYRVRCPRRGTYVWVEEKNVIGNIIKHINELKYAARAKHDIELKAIEDMEEQYNTLISNTENKGQKKNS